MRRYQTKSKIRFRTGLGLNDRVQRGCVLQDKKRRNQNDEEGIIIVLVAVFMLGAVGAMAALSIDVVTLYTARSEAQLAADAGALAAARVLANSGATSDATGALMTSAEPIANKVAIRVAQNSQVGGRNLVAANGEVTVSFSDSEDSPCVAVNPVTNPCVTVSVQRTDLPTFFARIWGSRQIKVAASATAEAYNPTNGTGLSSSNPPVAPTCVKPWLLPNINPATAAGGPIFDAVTGNVLATTLLGWQSPGPGSARKLSSNCTATGSCSPPTGPTNRPTLWKYYPATTDPSTGDFPAPTASSVACCSGLGFNNYQLSVAGCVQKPIACNQVVNIDTTPDPNRDGDTLAAVDGLTHSITPGAGDSVETNPAPPQFGTAPFRFSTGTKNQLVLSGILTADSDAMVSDSLVTVPVIDASTGNWPPANTTFPQVQIIGFLQLFLNFGGDPGDPAPPNGIRTKVINIVGCGNGATGTPIPAILGNGASPIAVRLISPN